MNIKRMRKKLSKKIAKDLTSVQPISSAVIENFNKLPGDWVIYACIRKSNGKETEG